LATFSSEKQIRKNGTDLFPKVILWQLPHKKKSRRQHQADKGGLPIIESSPWVRSNSIAPSKKLHNYANPYTFRILKATIKAIMNYEKLRSGKATKTTS